MIRLMLDRLVSIYNVHKRLETYSYVLSFLSLYANFTYQESRMSIQIEGDKKKIIK